MALAQRIGVFSPPKRILTGKGEILHAEEAQELLGSQEGARSRTIRFNPRKAGRVGKMVRVLGRSAKVCLAQAPRTPAFLLENESSNGRNSLASDAEYGPNV